MLQVVKRIPVVITYIQTDTKSFSILQFVIKSGMLMKYVFKAALLSLSNIFTSTSILKFL